MSRHALITPRRTAGDIAEDAASILLIAVAVVVGTAAVVGVVVVTIAQVLAMGDTLGWPPLISQAAATGVALVWLGATVWAAGHFLHRRRRPALSGKDTL